MDKTLADIKADIEQLKADINDTLTGLGDQIKGLSDQVGELKAQIANGGSVSQQDLNDLASSLESMDSTVKAAKPAVAPAPSSPPKPADTTTSGVGTGG